MEKFPKQRNRILKEKTYKMAKLESNFRNMFLVLLSITAIAAAALGGVYSVTKGPIEQAMLQKQKKAIEAVAPAFDNNPIEEQFTVEMNGGLLTIFPAKKGNEVVGAAIESFTNNGFSGLIKLMVGFDLEGNIVNYTVLEHKETPGLGSKMNDWFRDGSGNIKGKNPGTANLTVSKDKGEIDAITAATISSRAFLEGVQTAYKAYVQEIIEKNQKQ